MRKPRLLIFLGLLLLCPAAAVAQKHVNGMVTDGEKNPLIGVYVIVKGTQNGVATGLDGTYMIQVPDNNAVLDYSYIGYESQSIPVGNRININVTMQEEMTELDQVVVVGYGNQRKASVVGSIETIQPDNLQVGSSRSLSNNLAGQLAGVIGVQRSGEPGYDNSDIWIRGIASFSGSTNPLVLVDGIERSLNDIDPAEIESFSVLKDASASAVYGVRGANGVIIINTKRGQVGAPTVNFRIEQSVQQPTKLPQFIGAPEYMNLLNELAVGAGLAKPYSNNDILHTYHQYDPDLYPNVNWLDEITKDVALNTRANLSVSGGTEILRYSLVASYFGENGIMAHDKNQPYDTQSKLNRYNIRTNVDIDITKTTLLRINIGGYLQELRKSASGTDELFRAAFETPPFAHPPVYSDGTIPVVPGRYNPWAYSTQRGYYRRGDSKLESLFSVEQNLKMITPGLKAKVTFAFDNYSANFVTRDKNPEYYNVATGRDDEGELVHSIASYGDIFLGHSNNADFGNRSTYLEAAVTYNRNFGRHNTDAMLLYNQRSYEAGDIQPYRNQGIAGRFSYNYDHRYVAEFNFGYNGSENFARGRRYGFFPSAALGWIISEEPFMKNAKGVLSMLKLRGSIGQAGNDQIGGNRRFAYNTTVDYKNIPGYTWGTDGGSYVGGIQEGDQGVEDLTWETATKANIGLELGLWNALNIHVDLFREHRDNIFMQRRTIPTQSGFVKMPYANFGKVRNEGVEFSLNADRRFGRNWNVSLRGTFTFARNTVLERDEPESVRGTYRSETGRSLNTLWGLTATGLYTDADFTDGKLNSGLPVPQLGSDVRPGDIRYADLNRDGIIDGLDAGYIGGTEAPEIVYGFGGAVRYRSFDLSFFFQGVGNTWRVIGGGKSYYPGDEGSNTSSNFFIPGSGQGILGNVYANYNDRWTESDPSQDVFWPRLSYSTNYNNNAASTWWKKDMSFLRLKTVEIGYNLPESAARKILLKGLRVYVSGNNLFYFSKFKLWDPELATADGLRYPGMKSVILGLDIKF